MAVGDRLSELELRNETTRLLANALNISSAGTLVTGTVGTVIGMILQSNLTFSEEVNGYLAILLALFAAISFQALAWITIGQIRENE